MLSNAQYRFVSPSERMLDRLNEEEAALLAETIHALIEMTKTKSGVYFGPDDQKAGPKQ